jgi:hypothetical protein
MSITSEAAFPSLNVVNSARSAKSTVTSVSLPPRSANEGSSCKRSANRGPAYWWKSVSTLTSSRAERSREATSSALTPSAWSRSITGARGASVRIASTIVPSESACR